MPLLQVQRFRCKHCQDSGLLAVRGLSTLNPLNDRPAISEQDKRTGFDPSIAFATVARTTAITMPCSFCPPAPRAVYRRDWERA